MSLEVAGTETAAVPNEEAVNLSDHEQEFTGARTDAPSDDEAPIVKDAKGRPRHRAQSQQATPDDVKVIAEYTKRLRDAEEAAGIERKPGESDRVYQLRRRAELAEARVQSAKQPKAAAVPAPPVRPAPQPAPQAAATAFTDPEPTIEQFADAADPYSAWNRALAAWDRKKEAFEARQTNEKARTEHLRKQHDEQFNKWVTERQAEHDQRLGQFIQNNPAALKDMEAAANLLLTPVMFASIELHEQGPAFMLAMAKNPDLVDELFLLTEGKPVGDPLNNPLVAIVQRRLLQRVQAAQTGSAASPRQPPVAPRPPNPVRTAPQTPSDALPDDDSSLAAHEQHFGKARRRR